MAYAKVQNVSLCILLYHITTIPMLRVLFLSDLGSQGSVVNGWTRELRCLIPELSVLHAS